MKSAGTGSNYGCAGKYQKDPSKNELTDFENL
jgi:hypothetical protein